MKPTYEELEQQLKGLQRQLSERPEIEFHPLYRFQNLIPYIKDPTPENTFRLGQEYEYFGQTASAIGYYHKCAERTSDDLLAYECLLRMSICFREQGDRKAHEQNNLLMAIALKPERPEAYFLLSLVYERIAHEDAHQKWWDSYTYACIGDTIAHKEFKPLLTNVDYYGPHFFKFQKAVTLWWVGRCDDARDIFQEIIKRKDYPENIEELIKDNLSNLMKSKGRKKGL